MHIALITHPWTFRFGIEIDCRCEGHVHFTFSLALLSLDFIIGQYYIEEE